MKLHTALIHFLTSLAVATTLETAGDNLIATTINCDTCKERYEFCNKVRSFDFLSTRKRLTVQTVRPHARPGGLPANVS